jgi:hypothetical protein
MSEHHPQWLYPGNVFDELEFPCVVDADGCVIASVCDDGIDEDQQEANCHLIAAAPDLLVALKRLVGKYGYEDDNVTPKDWSEYVDAREVIARATGEQPNDRLQLYSPHRPWRSDLHHGRQAQGCVRGVPASVGVPRIVPRRNLHPSSCRPSDLDR